MSVSYRTPRRRVEGLGASHSGTHEFWRQRMTAVAIFPLAIWFVWSVLGLVGADPVIAAEFFASPLHAILMLLFIVAVLMHMAIGMQVIIEDYLHGATKIVCLMLNRFFVCAVGIASAYALVVLALAGNAL
jgi:succinate dehydrogenase / fumarate reductase membrane anchor subunit